MHSKDESKELDQEIMEKMLGDFISEARENLDHLNLCLIQMEKDPGDEDLIETVFRIFHTLKGSAAFAGLDPISTIARAFEDLMRDVRKGDIKIGASSVDVMYKGVDLISSLIDRAQEKEEPGIDLSQILGKIEKIRNNLDPSGIEDCPEPFDSDSRENEELLSLYKEGYNQLGALKHLIYSSVHLSDPETLAVLLSQQIHDKMTPERNGFWLLEGGNELVEIARNGELVEKNVRRTLDIESSRVLQRVIREQLTIWPSESESLNTLLPEYQSPVIFPIKSNNSALGLLILDPEERTEVELYQFISQFAAMIIRISKLHEKVDEQRKELDEMTGILFRQNSQLSSLYHVEMDLMQETDPIKLCDIVVDAIVNDLEAKRAAAFLYDQSAREFTVASQYGGLEGIVGNRYAVDEIRALARCLETGRIITQTDFGEPLEIGENLLESWIALSLKGREASQGVMVVEIEDEDIGDPISILTNYLGILLDNIVLQKKVEKEICAARN